MTSCAGVVVVTAAGVGAAAGLIAAAPHAGLLVLWGVGIWVLWRSVRSKIKNPSPTLGPPSTNDKRAGQRIAHSGGVTIVYPSDITQQTGRTLPGPSTGDET